MSLFSQHGKPCSCNPCVPDEPVACESKPCPIVHHWQFCNPNQNKNCSCEALEIGRAIADALKSNDSCCCKRADCPAFGTVYSQTPRGVTRGNTIIFDDISTMSEISLSPDNTTIETQQKGNYLLSYHLQIVAGAGAAAAIRKNGKILSGTRLDLENNTSSVSCVLTCPCEAGDKFELIILDRDISLSCGTNASLTLVKLG